MSPSNPQRPDPGRAHDDQRLRQAVAAAQAVRRTVSPRPWVGAVVVPTGAPVDHPGFAGATQGRADTDGRHAEVVALQAAGAAARGGTLYATLEPCAHPGRRPASCVQAIIDAGISRVVVAVVDPDPRVSGQGLAELAGAGLLVELAADSPGLEGAAAAAEQQLQPYLHHRRTGRPFVILKLAATLDGAHRRPRRDQPVDHRPDGPPRCPSAAGRLRRHPGRGRHGPRRRPGADRAPPRRRAGARLRPAPARRAGPRWLPTPRVQPALTLEGDLGAVLDRAGPPGRAPAPGRRRGPGGPRPARGPVWSIATCSTWLRPCSGATTPGGLFAGPGAPTLAELWRGRSWRHPRARRRPAPGSGAGPGCRVRGPARYRPGRRLIVFTGIVEELGTVAWRRGPRLRIQARTVVQGAALGDSTAVNGCCLTVVDFDAEAGWWEADVDRRDLRAHQPGCPGGRRSGEPRAPRAPGGPPGRPPGPGPRRRRGPDRAGRARPAGAGPGRPAALRGREGLDHRRRDQPDGGRRARRRLHRGRHPPHPGRDHPGRQGPRRPGQPRGRRDGQVRRAAVGRPARSSGAGARPIRCTQPRPPSGPTPGGQP